MLTPDDFGFGQLFWTMRDAVVVGDAGTGRMVLWNPAAEVLFGLSADEAIGYSIETLIPEALREQHRAGILRYHRTGVGALIDAGLPIEVPALRATGEPITIELLLTPVVASRVPGQFVVATIRDVTMRKQAELDQLHLAREQAARHAAEQAAGALRQSEERFRTAFDEAAIGMSLVGLDGHFLQVNAALCALTGYTEAELLTRTFQDITHPDDLTADLAQVQRQVAGGIASFQLEKRYLRKDGTVIWIRLNSSLVRDEHGEPLHFIGQLEDITARKAAEAALREAETKYRTLVEQLPAVVYLVANDAHYTPLFYNSYIETMTGETPEEVVARPGNWLESVHPEDRERVAAADARAARTGGVYQAEYRRRRRDGSYLWVRNEAVPLYDNAGQILAWQGVMFDISERKQAEEALFEAIDAAQAANQAKGVFLDLMSHELRTPLQAVLGYSEFLLLGSRESLTDVQREDLGYIHQGGRRMLTLINQVLDLSRMEAGGINLMSKPFDLHQVIEAVRQDIAPQAAAKGIAVEIALPPSLPRVTGDAERVRQILLNLAGNAVKFTQQGGIQITAAAAVSGGVVVTVSDTGIGITAEAMLHIFEAFHQVDSSHTRHHQGSGLGLAIAWKLAQQMGGSLSVRSEPGVGSTFTLYLPTGQP